MRTTLMAAASALALLAVPAMAQTTTGTTAPATTTAAPAATTAAPAVTAGEQTLPDSHILGSDLIGASVTNANGDSIGKTSDVLVTKDSKTVDAVVIDVGGFLGIGSKSVAIPLEQLTIGARPDQGVKTAMTKEQLEALPAFEGRKAEAPPPAGGTMGGSSTTGTTSGG
ncbi:sporulation protein YlmC with PRC-barrel domain [Inquilinus ginsengisoli]|uniref:Sporulation protein YlmC with PRC-barrel domain n=1 Tax=Inquilinus ginsengisoli TaxID=363840 RepID=A0ABU1JUX8_9PROT|nr:PRC-barrel domain-containing protein [Inquilinus ginsengisoli]MDR6292434.1 sporulation protein YlmC with PRC-barrel domain [Inquilinus ginsengisoli]